MSHSPDRVLTAHEAAGIIYNTPAPTDEQVNKVRAKLARGHIQSTPKGRWTTTSRSVAEYLAGRAIKLGGRMPASSGQATAAEGKQLSGYYRQLVKDYFFAVTLRRRSAHRSQSFARAVTVGQITVLLMAAWLFFQGYRAAVALTSTPEQRAVLAWLDANVERYKGVEWLPPVNVEKGTLVPVRYKYFENGKGISTQRHFIVRDGIVAGFQLEADDVP